MQQFWFAARTRDKQELSIRDSLEKLKGELPFSYFLPTRRVVRQLKYRRKRVEVPVIRNLIFVCASKQTAVDIPNLYSLPLFYMKDFRTGGMLVVPDKQMDDFMYVMNLDPESVGQDYDRLVIGSKVRIMKGDFSGVEGFMASEANKTYVVIRIEGVLTAGIRVPKSYLKVI